MALPKVERGAEPGRGKNIRGTPIFLWRCSTGWDAGKKTRKANDQRTCKRRNRPSPWPMLRNATVSEEDNHARFCSPAFRNRFHWWNG